MLEKQVSELRTSILPSAANGQRSASPRQTPVVDRFERLESQMQELLEAMSVVRNSATLNEPIKASGTERSQAKYDDQTNDDGQFDRWVLPTKIPKPPDSKRRSLVWKEDGDMVEVPQEALPIAHQHQRIHSLPNAASKSISRDIANRSPKIPPSATLAANAKLISALEAEENRLLENEAKYAEQIKSLIEKVATVEARAQKAEQRCGELEKLHEIDGVSLDDFKKRAEKTEPELEQTHRRLQELEVLHQDINTKLTSTLESAAQMQKQTSELRADNERLRSELANRNADFEEAGRSIGEAEIALDDMDQKLQAYEEERTHLYARMAKDREQMKVKTAEAKRESDIYKATIKQLQKEVAKLQTHMNAQTVQERQKAQEMFSIHTNEMRSLISMTTERLVERHRTEMDSMSKTVEHIQNAYAKLEREHEKAIKAEHARYKDLQASHEAASKRLAEQAETLKKAVQREKDLESMVRELNALAKEQQAAISDLETKSQISFTIYEEKLQQLQESLDKAEAHEADLRQQLADVQAEYNSKKDAADKMNLECQTLRERLGKKEEERSQAENKAKHFEEMLAKTAKAREDHDQSMRVKVKMLEDQNETIRKLKQNLDNKNREYQNLIGERTKREEALEDQIDMERGALKEMQHELVSQKKVIEDLQALVDEYKDERDTLRREIVDISKKLKDRNDSIERIEEEVARVRKVFKAKKEKLLQEKAEALKARDDETVDLRQAFEAQSARMAVFDRERDALVQKIKSLQRELDTTTDEVQPIDEQAVARVH
ncbi:hypothetical protein HDV00_005148 [Rhizophlyctis rosea]|nr:hypothetical protein HDV00_005148 [Rhizophlyctis rosea]